MMLGQNLCFYAFFVQLVNSRTTALTDEPFKTTYFSKGFPCMASVS